MTASARNPIARARPSSPPDDHVIKDVGEPLSTIAIATGVRALDGCTFLLAGVTSVCLLNWRFGDRLGLPYWAAAGVGAGALLLGLERSGAYAIAALPSLRLQLRLLARPLVASAVAAVLCFFLANVGGLTARAWLIAWLVTVPMVFLANRLVVCAQVLRWTARGRLARSVAVVGEGDFSQKLISRLQEQPGTFNVIGIFDDRHTRVVPTVQGVPLLGTVEDLLRRSRQHRIDVIVVALPLSAVNRIAQILEHLGSAVSDICLTTDLAGMRYPSESFARLGHNAVVSVREAPMKGWRIFKKVVFDYGIGSLALFLLSPALAIIALTIRLDSRGPVLFRQPRVGFNNRLFVCFKFRSMYQDMTDVAADRQATRDDPRVTRVGRYLRKFSLDELPQLLNVMNGTMSLVGPRPHAPNTKAADRLFTEVVQRYALRHRVRPGITGWAQVNGWRGETKTVDQIKGRVSCDLDYIEHWSVRLDLKILVMTVLREIRSKRAY